MASDEPSLPYASYQNEIYLAGVAGTRPSLPLTATGLEERAQQLLSAEAFGYVAGGAAWIVGRLVGVWLERWARLRRSR